LKLLRYPLSATESELCAYSSQHRLSKARPWIAHQAINFRIALLCDGAQHFHRTERGLRQSVKLHFNYL
jgi:hypothetical protein